MPTIEQITERAEAAEVRLRAHFLGRTELVDIARMFRNQIIPLYYKATWNDRDNAIADMAREVGMVLLYNGMLSGEMFHTLWLHACGLEAT